MKILLLCIVEIQMTIEQMAGTENTDTPKIQTLAYKDKFFLFDQLHGYKAIQPLQVDYFILVTCTKGHGKMNIDGHTLEISPGQLFFGHPSIVIEKSSVTLDFECSGMALSREFVEQIRSVAFGGGWNLALFISRHPVVSITHDEMALFKQYYDLLRSKIEGKPCIHQDSVMQYLFRAFMFEFFDMLNRFVEIEPQTYSSAESLFKRFLELVSSMYPRPRAVEAYADQLCVTPKYLSAVCKKMSGATASKLINQFIVNDVKRLLRNSDLSIKEISNELEFPNLSFFGKYVKRMLGMSPKAYRQAVADGSLPENNPSQNPAGIDAEGTCGEEPEGLTTGAET